MHFGEVDVVEEQGEGRVETAKRGRGRKRGREVMIRHRDMVGARRQERESGGGGGGGGRRGSEGRREEKEKKRKKELRFVNSKQGVSRGPRGQEAWGGLNNGKGPDQGIGDICTPDRWRMMKG